MPDMVYSAAKGGSIPTEFEIGRTLFAHDGRKGEYIGAHPSGALVRPVARFTSWEGEDFEEPTDAIEIWERAYPKPPVPVIAEEVAKGQAELTALREETRLQQEAAREGQRETLDMLKRLARYEPLKNLEPLLNGEITHVVEGNLAYITIKSFDEAKVYKEDYGRKDALRMLSLKPEPNGALSWHLNRWSDGSGADTPVILCTSEKEAKDAALAKITAALDRCDYDKYPHRWGDALKNANALGLKLPKAVIAMAKAYEKKMLQKAVEEAAAALAQATAALGASAGEKQDGNEGRQAGVNTK